MDIRQAFFTKNACFVEGEYIVPQGIMMHSTGANNPYLRRYLPGDDLIGYNSNGNDWDMSNKEAISKFGLPLDKCVNGFIGKDLNGEVRVYQTLPWNMRSWHCAGTGNSTHISFEICEDGLDDEVYFWKIYSMAAQLCAFLCKMYNMSIDNVICHSEGAAMGIASDHQDVMHWFPRFGANMDDFRKDVLNLMIFPYCAENDVPFEDAGLLKYPGKINLMDGGGFLFFGAPKIETDMIEHVKLLTSLPYTPVIHDTFFIRILIEIKIKFNMDFPIWVVPTQPTEEDYLNYILPMILEKRPSVATFLYDGVSRNRDYLYAPTSDFLNIIAAEGNRGTEKYTLATDDKYVKGTNAAVKVNGKYVIRSDASNSKSVTCTGISPLYVPYTNHSVTPPYMLEQGCAGTMMVAIQVYFINCLSVKKTGRVRTSDEMDVLIPKYCTKLSDSYFDDRSGYGLLILPDPDDINFNDVEEIEVRYTRLNDIPNENGFREVINTLMDAKIINGDGSDETGNNDIIDLSSDQVRSLIFEYRGGAFDRKLMSIGLPPAVNI